jgi:hypothetical protein
MEAASTSETSVDNYFTRQYIQEDNSELHTPRRENLKSHISVAVLSVNVFCTRLEHNFMICFISQQIIYFLSLGFPGCILMYKSDFR